MPMSEHERRQFIAFMQEFQPRAQEAWLRFVSEVETERRKLTDVPNDVRTGVAIARVFDGLTPGVIEAIGAYASTLAIDADARVLADREHHAHP